ncbi:hypothetical protein V8C42DRAFT_354689 [Trichoderma barbatum]
MATTVSEAPKMGIEMMLERIMGAMEKQNQEMVELRKECSELRTSNRSMEIMLQNIAVFITSPGREIASHSYPFPDREIPGFYVVIPAGGAGTRLWPLSRENHPKFLLDVNLCGNSLLQSTWERLLPLAGHSRMTVVAGPAHSEGILGQLPNLDPTNLFTEPGPKDSMAAIGLAAAILLRRDPDAIIGSFAADHMISGEEAFLGAVAEAVEVAREGYLVTIGIAPSHPATGFGYIRLGDRLGFKSAPHSRLVSSFKEKPDAHTAAKYLATGQYRWNAGMFVTKASLLVDLMKEHCPALYEGLMNISAVWDDEAARKVALEEVWPTLEKIPIDNAVAEPAAAQGKVAVIPSTFGWDDVGDFSSLAEMLPAESNKPRVLGDPRLVVSEQTAGGIVVPVSGRLITCLGVDDIVIVDAPDALMVTTRARSQEVKSLVKKCREAGWKNLLRPGEKLQCTASNEETLSRLSQSHAEECSPGPFETASTSQCVDHHHIKSISWSEAGSTANNTRRSSPADLIDIQCDGLWDFEESLAPFSSPSSEKNRLPDTMPLTGTRQVDESLLQAQHVDFSETASTARRSSPFGTSDGFKDIWNFDETPPTSGPSPSIPQNLQTSSSAHLPPNELYDSTPRKAAASTKATASLKPNDPVASGDAKGRPVKTALQSKGKKNRQRAKEPIKFDPLTQEIVDVSATKKKSTAARLPIVSALQQSATSSSSPLAVPQKQQKPKRARPAKKAKTEKHPAQDTLPPPRSANLAAFISSPAQQVVESPLECPKDPLSTEKRHSDMMACLAISAGDVFDTAQVPEQQHRRPPIAIDKRNIDQKDFEALSSGQNLAKRRRLSRQFSVSERGSPVVIKDTEPVEKADSMPAKSHPSMSSRPEPLTTAQSSSFLRTESSDRTIQSQHGNPFQDIEGRSSSQWLRRISDKEPTAQKRKSSRGRKLHDEIMRSFLGNTEVEQENQGAKPACAAIPSHAEAQMHRTVDVRSTQRIKLIARLNDRKMAAFKVVDAYRKNAEDSITQVKQHCLHDSRNLADRFRSDSGLFGKQLRAATAATKARSSARENLTVDLDNAIQVRRQGYGRARHSLREIRDELIPANGTML